MLDILGFSSGPEAGGGVKYRCPQSPHDFQLGTRLKASILGWVVGGPFRVILLEEGVGSVGTGRRQCGEEVDLRDGSERGKRVPRQ